MHVLIFMMTGFRCGRIYEAWCRLEKSMTPSPVFFSLTPAPVNYRKINSRWAMDRDNIIDNSPRTEIKRGSTRVVKLSICRSIIWITAYPWRLCLPSALEFSYPFNAVVEGLRVSEVYEGATSIVLGLSLLSALSQSHSISLLTYTCEVTIIERYSAAPPTGSPIDRATLISRLASLCWCLHKSLTKTTVPGCGAYMLLHLHSRCVYCGSNSHFFLPLWVWGWCGGKRPTSRWAFRLKCACFFLI